MAVATTSSVRAPADYVLRQSRPRSMLIFDTPSPDPPLLASSSSFPYTLPSSCRSEFSRRHTAYLSSPSRVRPLRSSPLAGPSLALSQDGTLSAGSDESGSLSYCASVSASAASTWSTSSSCEHGIRPRGHGGPSAGLPFALPPSSSGHSTDAVADADAEPHAPPAVADADASPKQPKTPLTRRLSLGLTKLRSAASPPVPPMPSSVTITRSPTSKSVPTSTSPMSTIKRRSILLPPAHSMDAAELQPPPPSVPVVRRTSTQLPRSPPLPASPTGSAHPHPHRRRSYLPPTLQVNNAAEPEQNWLTIAAPPRFSRTGLKADGIVLPVAANSKEGMRAWQRALSGASTAGTGAGSRPASTLIDLGNDESLPARPASMISSGSVGVLAQQSLHARSRSRSMNQLAAQYHNGEGARAHSQAKTLGRAESNRGKPERPATAPACAPSPAPASAAERASRPPPSLRRPPHVRPPSAASTPSPASSLESLRAPAALRPPLAPFAQDSSSTSSLASADTPSLAFTSGGSRTGSEASLALALAAVMEEAEVRVVGDDGDIGLQRLDVVSITEEKAHPAAIARPVALAAPVFVEVEKPKALVQAQALEKKDADAKSTHGKRARRAVLVRVRVLSAKDRRDEEEQTAQAPQKLRKRPVASNIDDGKEHHQDGGLKRIWRRVVQLGARR